MKKISFIQILVIALSVMSMASCRKEQYHYKGIPEVQTTDVQVLDGIGAHFKGVILATGETKVLQHGFAWSTRESDPLDLTYKALLGPAEEAGAFEFITQAHILAGQKYFVRAFIQTSTHLVFGETLTFTGTGSLGPVINSITPAEGIAGDTVVVRGKYFSTFNNANKVLFETQLLEPISSDEDEMKIIIPFGSYGKKKVSVQVEGITSTGEVEYDVLREVLTVFEPVTAAFGDTITLYGERLCILEDHVTVSFNDVVADITEIHRNYYKVTVPSTSTQSHAVISVKSWGSSSYADQFMLRQVSVESISTGILHAADTLTLFGAGFNPVPSMNRVKVGEEYATPLTCNGSSLRILVPWSLEPGIYDLTITTIDDQPVTYPDMIELRTQWKRLPDFPGLPRNDVATFVIGNKAYAGTGVGAGELLGDMWEFDAGTAAWTRKNDFLRATTEVVGFSGSGTGYMADFEAYDYPRCSLIAYNPVSDSWETKSPLPSDNYDGKGTGFIINGMLYIMKSTFTYGYTISLDSWSYVTLINNFYFRNGVAFSDGDYGYFGIGMEKGSTNTTRWYRYNPGTKQWRSRADFPGEARNSAVAFFLPNGKGYVGLGYSSSGTYLKDFWEYDPVNDRWKRLSDFPGEGRASAGAFAIGEQGYILTGKNIADLQDFWIFDPAALDF